MLSKHLMRPVRILWSFPSRTYSVLQRVYPTCTILGRFKSASSVGGNTDYAPTAASLHPDDVVFRDMYPRKTHKTAIFDQPLTNRPCHRIPDIAIFPPTFLPRTDILHTLHANQKPFHRLPAHLCSQSRETAICLNNAHGGANILCRHYI